MIIDFHTHMFPDGLAAKAVPSLAKKSGFVNQTDGTLKGTLDSMDKNGVDISVVCNIATNCAQTENVNKFAIEVNKNPRLVSFGSVHPDCDYKYVLDGLKDSGIKGIKLHPDYQGFFIDDAKMRPIYEEILKRDLVLIFHSGMDDGIGEPVHATPKRIENVIGMFRGEKVVFAHMGAFRMWEEVCDTFLGEDVYIDTSCSAGFIDEKLFEKMVAAHGTGRVLFASDLPWTNPTDGIKEIEGLNIGEDEKKNILGKNAALLLNIKVD